MSKPLSSLAFGMLLAVVLGGSAAGCELLVTFDRELLGTAMQCNSAAECDDGNDCTEDTCSAEGICVRTPYPDGPGALSQEPADCRSNVCDGGVVRVEFAPLDLFDDYNPCTDDVCDAQTFETSHPAKAFQTACDDGNGNAGVCGCVVDDELANCSPDDTIACLVACDSGNAATACNDANDCTEDSCNTAAGLCVHEGRDGALLSESVQVAGDCRAMVCVESAPSPAPGVEDNGDLPPDDGDVCTDEVCDAGFPVHRGNIALCDDGIYCNGEDTCVPASDPNNGGSCDYHPGDPCVPNPSNDDCTESCNEEARDCTANDPNGFACTDGSYCNGTESCSSGVCGSSTGNPCPARNPGLNDCTQTCTESGGGSCNGNDPSGAACNDNDYCTGTDTCNASGSCANHTGNPCSTNYSDADCTGTCRTAQADCNGPEPANSPCNDGEYCTLTDTCNASGSCANHTGNPCSTDYSDSNCTGTCRSAQSDCNGPEPPNSPCNDADLCNGVDTCNASGSCTNHTGDPCLVNLNDCDSDCSESCDGATGLCTANDPNGHLCDINGSCNPSPDQTCTNGVCG